MFLLWTAAAIAAALTKPAKLAVLAQALNIALGYHGDS